MRWSQFFIPTLRETPADAEVVSHKLLLRAGLIRQLSAGIYSYLPLAQRTLQKIEKIIREEMNAIGGQEFYLPALNPREIWEETGRWTVMGENMFRLKDRKGADLCLGMTHEEVFTSIARHEVRSYKQLPQIWYQIQTKFRDEPRPKSGLLRVRQFTMKDSYSFDVNKEGLDVSFEKHREAYCKIFSRCGLNFVMVEASSGAMGGSASTEFMVKTDAGEDLIAVCESSGYAANLEKASSKLPEIIDDKGLDAPEEFPTPGIKTIEQLANAFDFASAERQIKTLVYVAVFESDGPKFILAMLRGDHQLHETKLQDALGAIAVRPAQDEEIFALLGAHAGSLGGVRAQEIAHETGEKVIIIADFALKGRQNMTTGANKDDFHLRGVSPERDIQIDKFADLRTVQAGELSPDGAGTLEVYKSLEIGHIFKLGTKYSDSMGATVLDVNGKAVPIVMGSYGIGVERIMASVIEQNHDENGIIWTKAIAPFDVIVTVTNIRQPELVEAGEKIYKELTEKGFEVLLDDRDERAGVKFKDADLIGIPFRVTVGKKISENTVELFNRREQQNQDVKLEDLAETLKNLWETIV
jgi:prolyl-tRNA synthetase